MAGWAGAQTGWVFCLGGTGCCGPKEKVARRGGWSGRQAAGQKALECGPRGVAHGTRGGVPRRGGGCLRIDSSCPGKLRSPPRPCRSGGGTRKGRRGTLAAQAWGQLGSQPPPGTHSPILTGALGPEKPMSKAPTYANIPASPSPRMQLHYLGLELLEAGVGVRGGSPHSQWGWVPWGHLK